MTRAIYIPPTGPSGQTYVSPYGDPSTRTPTPGNLPQISTGSAEPGRLSSEGLAAIEEALAESSGGPRGGVIPRTRTEPTSGGPRGGAACVMASVLPNEETTCPDAASATLTLSLDAALVLCALGWYAWERDQLLVPFNKLDDVLEGLPWGQQVIRMHLLGQTARQVEASLREGIRLLENIGMIEVAGQDTVRLTRAGLRFSRAFLHVVRDVVARIVAHHRFIAQHDPRGVAVAGAATPRPGSGARGAATTRPGSGARGAAADASRPRGRG